MRSCRDNSWMISLALSLICLSQFAASKALLYGRDSQSVLESPRFRKQPHTSEIDQVEVNRQPTCSPICRSIKGFESRGDSVSQVHIMQEQIETAKKLASFVRVNRHPKLLKELKLQIKENEDVLVKSNGRNLPKSAMVKMKNLERVLAKAGEQHSKCETTVRRLKSAVLLKEEEVHDLREESTFLGRLAARTMPKGMHCLSLQLTIQYYNQLSESSVHADSLQLENNRMYHYVLYTENILAAAAVINSTIFYAKEPHMHVFHLLTDGLNYAAMQMWFKTNKPREVIVEVKNLDEMSELYIAQPFRRLSRKYLKLDILEQKHNFGTLRTHQFPTYLPDMFPKLDKLLVVDDDVLVRKDLTYLWNKDLSKTIIGTVQSCAASSHHDTIWWSCLNVVDLQQWRRQRVSKEYEQSIHNLTSSLENGSLKHVADNTNHIELDDCVSVLDLGETPEVEGPSENIALIHYGGYAKPWLGLGLSKYRSLWTRFINYDSQILQECNIHK